MTAEALRPARGRGRIATKNVAVAIWFLVIACGPAPPTGPGPSSPAMSTGDDLSPPPGLVRLIVLTGPAEGLQLLRFADGTPSSLVLPSGRPAWVSGTSALGLVLTERDGTIRVAAPFGTGSAVGPQPTWTTLRPRFASAVALRNPLSFATLSPDGSRVAAIADDPAAGNGPGQLVIIEGRDGRATAIDLDATTDGRPPAWIGADRILVPTRDANDRTDVTAVDPGTGTQSHWALETTAIAVAPAADVMAIQERSGGQVAVGSVDALANGTPAAVVDGTEPGAVAAQLMLDVSGSRLAIAWLDEAGDTTILAVYGLAEGRWLRIRRDVLRRGTARAIIAGFDP